jgi:hypothetical protein
MNKAGLFGGGWEDYLDALNEAFDRHVAENMPPHPFGASVDAIMTGYADAPQSGDGSQGGAVGGIGAVADPVPVAPEPQNPIPPQTATSVLGRAINGGSSVGDALRQVPLIGGILGDIGDVGEGAAHLLTGDFSKGAQQITGGVGGLGQTTLADALAAGAGAVGKAWVTGVDLANVLSGGTMSMPDRSTVGKNMSDPTGFGGALERFAHDLPIPAYGLNSGANWGSTQWGNHGPFFNLTDDAARVHHSHLNDREWDRNIWSAAPDGVIPNGPVGIANFVLGAIPFWLRNETHPEADKVGEVTLTK